MLTLMNRALGHVAFIAGWQGLVLAVLFLLQPTVAIAAALAMAMVAPLVSLLRCHDIPRDLLLCNALLAGAAIGAGGAPIMAMLLAAALAGVLSMLIAAMLQPLFLRHGLPIFSLPFAIAASCLALLAPHFGPGPMIGDGTNWPLPLLSDLGAIVFLPHAVVGCVVLMAIMCYSPLMAVMAVCGHAVASLTLAALDLPLSDGGFNAPLAAMAVSCIMLVPTRRALAIGLLAALVAGLLSLACDRLFVDQAVLTLPFNIAAIITIACLALRGDALLWRRHHCSPEAALAEHLQAQARWPTHARIIAMPVHGYWDVWQGSDGSWTHQGSMRHAIDLIIRDYQGDSHKGSGAELEDYHAWKRPVCAPVAGQIVAAVDGIADNLPGHIDSERNWGNYLVIADARGFWVLLAHLACGSLQARVGQWVSQGAPIACCGNSGYSPQPHLHLQVQAGPLPGAPTLPFCLGSCLDQAGRFHAAIAAQEDQRLRSACADRVFSAAMTAILDRHWRFALHRDDQEPVLCDWCFRMDAFGSTWLTAAAGRLRIRQSGGIWMSEVCEGTDPGLRLLARALPSLPLGNDDCHWRDVVPARIACDGWRGLRDSLLAPLLPERACRIACLERIGQRIRCNIGERQYLSEIDPVAGILRIEGDGMRLQALPAIDCSKEQNHAA